MFAYSQHTTAATMIAFTHAAIPTNYSPKTVDTIKVYERTGPIAQDLYIPNTEGRARLAT